MKSEKIEQEGKEEITYPCLMIGNSGRVVLFRCEGEGTIIYSKQK